MKKVCAVLLSVILVLCLGFTAEGKTEKIKFNNPDFIRGMDVSSVLSLEKAGVSFADKNGNRNELFRILARNGVNYIRVRVWNDPYNSAGNGYGGGNCDVNAAATIGRRAAQYGMKLLVDFHYSDFWADPAAQKAPKAWAQLTLAQKCTAVKEFTLSSLKTIKAAGADVGMVQVGNETNSGIAGESNYDTFPQIFSAGSEAVREFDSNCLVAVHFTNPNNADTMKWYAKLLDEHKVDYDVFASSYYPNIHGSLENLTEVFTHISKTYGKYTMVAETSYPYTLGDTDGFGNLISEGSGSDAPDMLWDYSPDGQAEEVRAVMNAVNNVPDGKGLGMFYWEGAWITVGDTTGLSGNALTEQWKKNSAVWEKYGCGWASSYSAEYDPDNAGKWYGGSSVDNQAFFDAQGKALPSLSVFRDVFYTHGDVDRDGELTVADATAIQRYIVALESFDNLQLGLADFNDDGVIDVMDATAIQRFLVGLQ